MKSIYYVKYVMLIILGFFGSFLYSYQFANFYVFLLGSGKCCRSKILPLVQFKGNDPPSALLSLKLGGVNHAVHKSTVPVPIGQPALGGYIDQLGASGTCH